MFRQLTLAFFAIAFSASAQVYKAGFALPYYLDIVPDTTLTYQYHVGASYFFTESYFIDINGDTQNDLKMESWCVASIGGGNGYLKIKSLNNKTLKRLGRIDVKYNDKVAKPLSYGDTINSPLAIWDSTSMVICKNIYYPSTSTIDSINDWISASDYYLGAKYQDVNDTIIGWIRINCRQIGTKIDCRIKDFSFSKNYSGIHEINENGGRVYPNPFTNEISFEYANIDKIKNIKIKNLYGEEIDFFTTPINSSYFKIHIATNISAGMYILEMQTEKGSYFKRLIK